MKLKVHFISVGLLFCFNMLYGNAVNSPVVPYNAGIIQESTVLLPDTWYVIPGLHIEPQDFIKGPVPGLRVLDTAGRIRLFIDYYAGNIASGKATYFYSISSDNIMPEMVLPIPYYWNSYRVFADYSLAGESGVAHNMKNIMNLSGFVLFKGAGKSMDIIVQSTWDKSLFTGFGEPSSIGPRNSLIMKNRVFLMLEAVVIGITLLMLIYSLIRIACVPGRRSVHVILGVFSLSVLLYTLFSGVSLSVFQGLTLDMLFRLRRVMLILSLVSYVCAVYAMNIRRLYWKTLIPVITAGLLFILTSIILPFSAFPLQAVLIYLFFIITVMAQRARIITKSLKRRVFSLVMTVIFLITFSTMITDFIHVIVKPIENPFLPYGYTFFILACSGILLINLAKSRRQALSINRAFIKIRNSQSVSGEENEIYLKNGAEQQGMGQIIRNYGVLDKLTRREKEIAELLYRGLSYKDIAGRLFISEKTVNIHVQNVYKKTGVASKTQLIYLFSIYK